LLLLLLLLLQGIPPMKEGGKRTLLIPAGTPQLQLHSNMPCHATPSAVRGHYITS
jgi:hypothetical protein